MKQALMKAALELAKICPDHADEIDRILGLIIDPKLKKAVEELREAISNISQGLAEERARICTKLKEEPGVLIHQAPSKMMQLNLRMFEELGEDRTTEEEITWLQQNASLKVSDLTARDLINAGFKIRSIRADQVVAVGLENCLMATRDGFLLGGHMPEDERSIEFYVTGEELERITAS